MEIKHIGIFRALHLGDMLCIVPAVRALRAAYPNAHITLIGLPWEQHFVKRFSKYFNHFLLFPGWPGLPEQELHTEKILTFLQHVRQQNFDLLLQMQGNGILTNSMCMLWGAKMLCGLRKADDYAPDERLFPVSEDDEHEVLRFLKLLEILNIPTKGTDLEFPLYEDEWHQGNQIIQALNLKPGKYVCVHPGARDKRRRWSLDHFVFIAQQLMEKGHQILLTGSGEEASLLQDLEDRTEGKSINLVKQIGHVDIGELAVIIQNSTLLVCNDTGVSHIASALKVPSVVIFSPFSTFTRWAPLHHDLNKSISFEKAKDPEYVLYCILDQLEKFRSLKSSPFVLLN